MPEAMEHMEAAFAQARRAADLEEVPIGCVLVRNGRVVAEGCNATNRTKDVRASTRDGGGCARRHGGGGSRHGDTQGTRHAEMEAIDSALRDNVPLPECELYVTCEPCIMCAAALSLVGVKRVVYGCPNDKFGGCGTVIDVHDEGCGGCGGRDVLAGGAKLECVGGVMKDEAVALLRTFYERGNPGAPKPHRPVVPRA